jgi:hypothetical protein
VRTAEHDAELARLRADAGADRLELLAGKARLSAENERLRRQLAERDREVADRDRALALLLDVTASVTETARVALGEGVTRVLDGGEVRSGAVLAARLPAQDAPVIGDPAPAGSTDTPVSVLPATQTDPSPSEDARGSVPVGALRVVILPRAGSGEARGRLGLQPPGGTRLPAQKDGLR